MGPTAIRARLHSGRRRLATTLVVFGLLGAVGLHHSVLAMDHGMPGMHHDAASTAMQVCLGAFAAVGAAVAALSLGVVGLGRWRPLLLATLSRDLLEAPGRTPRARDGPGCVQATLCIWRR